MNAFLEYYGEHKISPVVQDISDLSAHYQKREKLYRQLGMPPILFQNANILEVGPGGGYNSLAFLKWGGYLHLVEANPKGISDMKELFAEKRLCQSKYKIFESTIEDFKIEKKYDIIIAEGFLHSIDNAKNIINKLKENLIGGGVIVITCMDEMSMFVEQMKRLVCQYMISDIHNYDDRVRFSTELFQPQFENLHGMSRKVEDWVKDDMLNPAFNNKIILDMAEAIRTFGEEFYVLGSSQKIFTDYSWYKDLSYNENENCMKQYSEKQHLFFMTGIEENKLNKYDHDFLKQQISTIRTKCILFEDSHQEVLDDVLYLLNSIIHIAAKIDIRMLRFIEECIKILMRLKKEKRFELKKYQTFCQAVGRTQQYLSMVKKCKY